MSEKQKREWDDSLCVTSLVYLLLAIECFILKQPLLMVLTFLTWICSSLYHRNKEECKKCMLCDSFFATTCFVIAFWAIFLNIFKWRWDFFLYFSIIFTPIALFLNMKSGRGETDNLKHYELYHNIWHIVSGVGFGVVIYYFHLKLPHSLEKMVLDNLKYVLPSFMIVPLVVCYMIKKQKMWLH